MLNLIRVLLAAMVGCATQEGATRPQQVELRQNVVPASDYPFVTKQVHLDGIGDMHYIDAGDANGETLLLIHGNPTWSYLWRNSIPLLDRRFRVIAPDLFGHGRSPQVESDDPFRLNLRAVAMLIDTLNLRQITLVGHDWGGSIAYTLAPAVKGLKGVVVCEPVLPRAKSQLSFMARMFRGTDFLAWYMRWTDLFISGVAYDLQMDDPDHEPIIRNYRRPFEEKGNGHLQTLWWNALPVADETLNDNHRFLVDAWSRFKASALPKLLIYGDPGMTVTPGDIPNLKSEMRETAFAFIGSGSHFFPEKYPRQFAQIVSDWATTRIRSPRD